MIDTNKLRAATKEWALPVCGFILFLAVLPLLFKGCIAYFNWVTEMVDWTTAP